MTKCSPNDPTRRGALMLGLAGIGWAVGGAPALALTVDEARALVDRVVADINGVIAAGGPPQRLFGDFRRIFDTYGDMPLIARFTLGAPARGASADELRAYRTALAGYMSRKYGRRFGEFIGGQITVRAAHRIGDGRFEVRTIANLRGRAPFAVDFLVSDRSGRNLFYDIRIEGISISVVERGEIRALLDRNRGSIPGLVKALNRL